MSWQREIGCTHPHVLSDNTMAPVGFYQQPTTKQIVEGEANQPRHTRHARICHLHVYVAPAAHALQAVMITSKNYQATTMAPCVLCHLS